MQFIQEINPKEISNLGRIGGDHCDIEVIRRVCPRPILISKLNYRFYRSQNNIYLILTKVCNISSKKNVFDE